MDLRLVIAGLPPLQGCYDDVCPPEPEGEADTRPTPARELDELEDVALLGYN